MTPILASVPHQLFGNFRSHKKGDPILPQSHALPSLVSDETHSTGLVLTNLSSHWRRKLGLFDGSSSALWLLVKVLVSQVYILHKSLLYMVELNQPYLSHQTF